MVYLKVQDSQTYNTVGIFNNFFGLFEFIEGCCVGCHSFVPHSGLVVAAAQFEVDLTLVDWQHSRILGEIGDDLAVVGRGSFVLQLLFFAVSHEEAPFGLGADVDEAVLFFVVVEEILQLIDLIVLNHLQGLVEVLLDQEAGVAVIVFG